MTLSLLRIIGSALVLAVVAGGCGSMATRTGFYEPATEAVRAGQPDSAVAVIEAARLDGKYSEKDRLVYFLDAGFLNHFSGRYEASNEKLLLADAAAEELFTKSISKAALSMLLNDNALEYSGEDYEILYGNLISALNYAALGQFDDAFVEIRRSNLMLQKLEQKYADAKRQLDRGSPDDTAHIEIDYEIDKVRFLNDAFARWLSMHMYAADGKFDDADIDYSLMVAAYQEQPHIYGFDVPTVKYHSADQAVLSVVSMIGLAPVKESLSLRIRTDKDLGLVQVLYDGTGEEDTEYTHFPINVGADYYFKFAIPQLVDRPSEVGAVQVLVDSVSVGYLQLIEDVGQVVRETYSARKTMTLVRSVGRAVVKGLATHKLKKEADTGGFGGWLKKAAIDVASDFTENADLRCSRFLPGRILIGDFEIAPGRHSIEFVFKDHNGHELGRTSFHDYPVSSSGLNLLSTQWLN